MGKDTTEAAAERLLDVLALAERLKRELRHSWLSDGRRESVAEHTWSVALMALLAGDHLERPVRLDSALAMAVLHDLAEAEVGDVLCFETGERRAGKAARERAAMERIAAMLPAPAGGRVLAL